MFATAVRNGANNSGAWTDHAAPPEGLPGGFDQYDFWLHLLQDWDSLPLNRPTHLEHWGASHITGKSSRHPTHIRRLAITLPLTWALRVLAGTKAFLGP